MRPHHQNAHRVVPRCIHRLTVDRGWVSYKDAKHVSDQQIDQLVGKKLMIKLEPVSDGVLTKILEGAKKSDDMPLKYRKILADQGLINE
jgi:hypothetical protein